MTTLAIDFPEEVFSSLKYTPNEFIKQMRLASAMHWYAKGKTSQEKAAMIAELDRVDFLEALAREKIEVFPVNIDSLKQEIDNSSPLIFLSKAGYLERLKAIISRISESLINVHFH